jgi:hypothetical protein
MPLTSRRDMQIKPIKRASDIRIYQVDDYNFHQTTIEITWQEWEFPSVNAFSIDNKTPLALDSISLPEHKKFRVAVQKEFLHEATPFDLEKRLYILLDQVFQMDIPELNAYLHGWIRKSVHELEIAGYPKYTPAPDSKNDYRLSAWSKELPGVNDLVKNPMTDEVLALREVIINLNDRHKWTREQIADWIETLDIDTRFKVD